MTGKTQIDLAERMNTTEQTVSNWVNRKASPSTLKLEVMAVYFDMSVSEFIKNGESK